MRLSLDLGLGSIALNRGVSPVTILGSSLIAWWTADRPDLISLNGTAVTSWKDVTHGYDAVQAVSASRPVMGTFGTGPGVVFDGTDDELTSTDAGLLAVLPDGAEPGEVWLIGQQNALAADTTVRLAVSYGGATSSVRRGLERAVVSAVNRARVTTGSGGGATSVTDTEVDLSTRHVVRARFAAADQGVSVDDAAEISNAVVPATTATRLRFGSISNTTPANFWSGVQRDVLITGPLSVEQVTALETWALPRRLL